MTYRDERVGMQAKIDSLEREKDDLEAQLYIKNETRRSARWTFVQRVARFVAIVVFVVGACVGIGHCVRGMGTSGYIVVHYTNDGRPADCWFTPRLKIETGADATVSFLQAGGRRVSVAKVTARWEHVARDETIDEVAAREFRLPKGFCK